MCSRRTAFRWVAGKPPGGTWRWPQKSATAASRCARTSPPAACVTFTAERPLGVAPGQAPQGRLGGGRCGARRWRARLHTPHQGASCHHSVTLGRQDQKQVARTPEERGAPARRPAGGRGPRRPAGDGGLRFGPLYGPGTGSDLLAAGCVVGEYHLIIHPIALGAGLPLFADLTPPLNLQAVDTERFDMGVVRTVFRRVGHPGAGRRRRWAEGGTLSWRT
jgi:hypothetical protein